MISREEFALIFENNLNKQNLTLSQFAARMTDFGMKTSYQQAYRWKKGKSLPNALQLVAICNVLHINHVPLIFSDQMAKKILASLTAPADNIVPFTAPDDSFAEEAYRITDRQLPVILQKASAGLGQYIDDADMEMVYVRENVPEAASFGIHVSGDSMEPHYHNGDLVWVEKKDVLNSGEIGVFYLDGNVYIKKLQYDSKGAALISLSKKYKPLPILDTSVFTVWGRVLS